MIIGGNQSSDINAYHWGAQNIKILFFVAIIIFIPIIITKQQKYTFIICLIYIFLVFLLNTLSEVYEFSRVHSSFCCKNRWIIRFNLDTFTYYVYIKKHFKRPLITADH